MALLPDYEDQVIKEGFLCPVCLEDFPGINELQAHFTSGIHDEDQDADADDVESARRLQEEQTIGATRGHMEYLRQVRCSRSEWYQEQTDKLLDRLERLTTIDAPAEEEKKLLEKQVVVWVNDSDVRLCPGCAKSFNLTRRRHHCRLCGAIMCNACSQFIGYEEARNLVDPDEPISRTGSEINPRQTLSVLGAATSLKNSIRRGSTTSLLSVVNQNKDQTNVRMCFDCKVLIDRRHNLLEEKKSGHSITLYYNKLRERMEETEKLVHDYYKICYSFSLGESVYDLQEAQQMRVKLIKLSEEIDILSRKIGTLGVTDPTPPQVAQIQLQTKIRMAATNFLKQYTLGLQSLPSHEELEAAKRLKKQQDEEQAMNKTRKLKSSPK